MFTVARSVLILLFANLTLHAAEFDFRLGGFVPQSHLFRQIYGAVLPTYQIEAVWDLPRCFQIWANLSYITKCGESHALKFKTRLHMVPASIGARYIFNVRDCTDFYVGAGLSTTWLKEKKCGACVPAAHRVCPSVGAIVKTGVIYHHDCFDFLLFGDYLVQQVTVRSHRRVNCNGLLFGLGLAVSY